MNWKHIIVFLMVFGVSFSIYSQEFSNLDVKGTIYGEVVDLESNLPIEFATVALYNLRSDEVVSGRLTNDKGQFHFKELDLGVYTIEISFIGYKKTVINQVLIIPKQPEVYFGVITLEPSVEKLEAVEVTGEKEEVIFKADRKVINIESNITAQGGTLIEALENQPSVKTDMDGNMTLRGSPSFTVLINGKPSALKGSNALQQIPANTVESVEIITNPSAKFDSEGEVGIVNVITKKEFSEGVSGAMNVGGGSNSNFLGRYSGDAHFQLSQEKLSFSLGANSKYSPMEGEGDRIRETNIGGDINSRNSDMEVGIYRANHNFKTGITYNPGITNFFSWDFSYGKMSFEREYLSKTLEASDTSVYISSITNANDDRRIISSSLGFEHLLDLSNGHKIAANLFHSQVNGIKNDDLLEQTTTMSWVPQELIVDQGSHEEGKQYETRFNLDYDRPLAKDASLEAGYQLRYETTELSQQVSINDPEEITDTQNEVFLTRAIHAWYLQLTGEIEAVAYQIGLRPEATYRTIEQTGNSTLVDYFNLFPSANLSYSYSHNTQLRLGYSKRINRPGINQLNPYLQLIDEKTQRSGNVDLLPEYVHSFELSLLKRILFSFVSADVFYRQTEDKMSPVWSAGNEDRLLLTYDNLAQDYSFGTEFLASIQLKDWWRISLSSSVYRYNINGNISGEEVNNSSNSWNGRFGSTFNLKETNTSIQCYILYNSEVASSQGARQGFFATMIGVKQQLLKNKLDVSLQVRDALSTIRFSNESSNEFFTNRMSFSPYTPVFTINLSYRFNSYKKRRSINASDINELDFNEDFNF